MADDDAAAAAVAVTQEPPLPAMAFAYSLTLPARKQQCSLENGTAVVKSPPLHDRSNGNAVSSSLLPLLPAFMGILPTPKLTPLRRKRAAETAVTATTPVSSIKQRRCEAFTKPGANGVEVYDAKTILQCMDCIFSECWQEQSQQSQQQQQQQHQDKPCISALLFACCCLHLKEQQAQATSSRTDAHVLSHATPLSTRRQTRCMETAEHVAVVQPILPILQGLVCVEGSTQRRLSLTPPLQRTARRQVDFTHYNASTLAPAIDRLTDSELLSRTVIAHMVQTKRALDASLLLPENERASLVQLLQGMLHYMTGEEGPSCLPALQLARPDVPRARWQRIIQYYHSELSLLQRRLLTRQNTEPLELERRLVERLSLAIRYECRVLLNPVPPRHVPDNPRERPVTAFSTVGDHCQLWIVGKETRKRLDQEDSLVAWKQLPTLLNKVKLSDMTNDAVDDSCLSALLSVALLRLTECCGLDALMQPTVATAWRAAEHVPDLAKNEGDAWQLPDPAATVDDDADMDMTWHDVEADLDQFVLILTAARAARFLSSLLQLPDVRQAVERQGGWGEIETRAEQMVTYRLHADGKNDDEHLMALANMELLEQNVGVLLLDLEQHVARSLKLLVALHRMLIKLEQQQTATNKHAKTGSAACNKKASSHLVQHVHEIMRVLRQGVERLNKLPFASAACEADDDDENA